MAVVTAVVIMAKVTGGYGNGGYGGSWSSYGKGYKW